MIPDQQTNTVYISDLLEKQHARILQAFRQLLGVRLKTIPGTKDIWCRDFMPIQLASNQFVQFKYAPDYLRDDPQLRTQNACDLLRLKNCRRSDLVIDGGNVVRWTDAAILTDKVYYENTGKERSWFEAELRRQLQVERLIFVPQEPGDTFGHADGMVRFVNEDTLFVNNYERVGGKMLRDALAGFELIPFPYSPTHELGSDPEIDSAVGVYMNFLQVGNLIVCPIFNQAEDDEALRTLAKTFPKARIVPLECRKLALEGGVLNCVTWNIRG